jgi:hypothetical protein
LLLTDESLVKGFWSGKDHKAIVKGDICCINIIKEGAIWPDKENSGLMNMHINPSFHGYFAKDDIRVSKKANYIEAYMIIVQYASQLYKYKGGLPSKKTVYDWFGLDINKAMTPATDVTKEDIVCSLYNSTNNAFIKNLTEIKLTSNVERSYFIFGIALHSVADMFAHSAKGFNYTVSDRKIVYEGYKVEEDTNGNRIRTKKVDYSRIVHKGVYAYKITNNNKEVDTTINKEDGFNWADNVNCVPKRWESAVKVCGQMIEDIKYNPESNKFMTDLLAYSKILYETDNIFYLKYKLINFGEYIKPSGGELDSMEQALKIKKQRTKKENAQYKSLQDIDSAIKNIDCSL